MPEPASLSFDALEKLGRIRLSDHFFLRDFLYSEVAIKHGIVNAPDDVDLAVEAGSMLCSQLLEPLQARFGRIHVRSAFRSCRVNALGSELGMNCARNEANYADHIWDRKDAEGNIGATACIVIPEVADVLAGPGEWVQLAWWTHDRLPYSTLWFFTKMLAFNVQWRQNPVRRIDSYAGWFEGSYWKRQGTLTKPGWINHGGDHGAFHPKLSKAFFS